ncbi:hypothetical protein ACFQL4_03925 [Halosimplex aquaticum]
MKNSATSAHVRGMAAASRIDAAASPPGNSSCPWSAARSRAASASIPRSRNWNDGGSTARNA